MTNQLFSCEQLIRNQRGRVYCKVLPDGMRIFSCEFCGEFKSEREMIARENGYPPRRCKVCVSERNQRNRETNREGLSARRKAWYRSKGRRLIMERHEVPEMRARRTMASLKTRCKKRGIPLDIDIEWILTRFLDGRCEVTGIEFDLKITTKTVHISPWSPTIDRRNPDGGYLKDNCRMVVWAYNLAKARWTDDVVRQLAEAITRRQDRDTGDDSILSGK